MDSMSGLSRRKDSMTSQRLHTVCVVYIYSDFTSRLNLHYMFIKACDVKSLFTDTSGDERPSGCSGLHVTHKHYFIKKEEKKPPTKQFTQKAQKDGLGSG